MRKSYNLFVNQFLVTPSTTNLYLGNPLRKQAVFISIRGLLAWVGPSALVYWSHQSGPNGCGVSPFRTSRRALRAAKVRRRIANCVGPCCALIALVTKRESKKKVGLLMARPYYYRLNLNRIGNW